MSARHKASNRLTRLERQQRWQAAEAEGRRNLGRLLEDKAAKYLWQQHVADSALTPATKLVALVLSLYGTADGGDIYPSVRKLASRVGYSQRTVCTHLDVLVRLGWLARRPRSTSGGWGMGVLYLLQVPLASLDAKRLAYPEHRRRSRAERASTPLAERDSTLRTEGAEGGFTLAFGAEGTSAPGVVSAERRAVSAEAGAVSAEARSISVLNDVQPISSGSNPISTPRECPPRRTSRARSVGTIPEEDPEIQRKRQQAAALVDQLTKRRAIS